LDIEQHTIQLTISVGIAPVLGMETPLMEVINQADQALYMSKSDGRNRVSVENHNQQRELREPFETIH
jgi:diguanylate cyclase (GGDEF)-like protein